MTARRIFAVPLFLIGGAILLATALVSIAGGLYYTVVGVVLLFNGQIGQGLLSWLSPRPC